MEVNAQSDVPARNNGLVGKAVCLSSCYVLFKLSKMVFNEAISLGFTTSNSLFEQAKSHRLHLAYTFRLTLFPSRIGPPSYSIIFG